ncbi:MAG: hypothetical protein ACE5JD_05910 [Candidatus Methylomirabilia bacterium]
MCLKELPLDVVPHVRGGRPGTELPGGRMYCDYFQEVTTNRFRHTSTVGVIDHRTGEIIWKIGPPPLAQQHDCRPLPNGNALIFDNGVHRFDHPMTWSRVIEVDPKTKKIVWEYVSPHLFMGVPTGLNNWIFRALRYSEEEVARARATAG